LRGEACLTDVFENSLCGSVLTTPDGCLLGHHVAYVESINKGVIRIFSKKTRDVITQFFNRPSDFNVALSPYSKSGSAAFLDKNKFSIPSTKNTIVPSLVNGIFEETRKPVNFSDKPYERFQELSKASLVPTKVPILKYMPFAEDIIRNILNGVHLSVWTEENIISGGEFLNPIDKTTSVGYGLSGTKSDYIDYENRRYKPELRKAIIEFETDVLQGRYPEYYFAEQYKLELKDSEKVNKPRLFKMSPLVHTILIRKYFGNLLTYIHNNKRQTGIQVGINPFSKDWETLAKDVTSKGGRVFAGDFKFYDKKMLSVIQQSINSIILEQPTSFTANERKIAEFLLFTIIYTQTISFKTTYITNHSLPSGLGMTAEYNSLVNKMYTAYAFAECYFNRNNHIPTIQYYYKHVYNAVYGDDNINGISNEVSEFFNGETMQASMQTIGLDYTPADKTPEWKQPYGSLEDASFLKRTFRYHTRLQQMVAPLDKVTMCGTLNYVKDDFRNEELTLTKLQNFQREAFLHELDYPTYFQHITDFTHENDFNFIPLTIPYLITLYNQDLFIIDYFLNKQ
jgi:hypothetical protein